MLIGLSSWGCGASPARPSPTSNPVGTWVGTASDSAGTRQVRFDLFKSLSSASKFDGLSTFSRQRLLGRLGTIDATLSRSTFSFTLTIPGGCSPFGPACDLVTTGSATIDAANMTGWVHLHGELHGPDAKWDAAAGTVHKPLNVERPTRPMTDAQLALVIFAVGYDALVAPPTGQE